MFYAKRARMTEPKNPLWRMAIPITPNEKGYRPSHRAGNSRGALCWDTSYISTIGLEGTELGLEKVLRGVGIAKDAAWSNIGSRWREGKRTWTGWLTRNDADRVRQISLATVVWSHTATAGPDKDEVADEKKKMKKSHRRRLLIRVHPSAF